MSDIVWAVNPRHDGFDELAPPHAERASPAIRWEQRTSISILPEPESGLAASSARVEASYLSHL